jgi:hypothetical protein
VILFDRDTINAVIGTVVVLRLKLNKSEGIVIDNNCYIDVESDSNLELAGNTIISNLPQNENTWYFPVNILIPQTALQSKLYEINASLVNSMGDTISQAKSYINVHPVKKVSMSVHSSSFVIKEDDDFITIPVHLTNQGNTDEIVTVVVQTPFLKNNRYYSITGNAVITAFSDTILNYSVRIPDSFNEKNVEQVKITGLYSNGLPFGRESRNLTIYNSKRDYRKNNRTASDRFNDYGSIALSGRYLFTPLESYRLVIDGDVFFPSGIMNYNIDFSYWRNDRSNPFLAKNTFLHYKHRPDPGSYKAWSIRVGTIYRHFEINVSGRGGALSFNDNSGLNFFEAGVAKQDYNLFNLFKNSKFWEPATSYWYSWNHKKNQSIYSSTFLHQVTPYFDRRSDIFSNSFKYTVDDSREIGISVNIGQSSSISTSGKKKYGFSGSFDYRGELGKYLISSSNYFSSYFYPGDKQGVTNLNQRLSSKPGDKGRYWICFNANYFNPGQLPGKRTGYLRNYRYMKAGAGYSFRRNKYSFSIQPLWRREKNRNYSIFNLGGVSELESFDLETSFTCSEAVTGQFISAGTTFGVFKTNGVNRNKPFHFKTQVNWRYSSFNLHASWQSGYFHLGEAVSVFSDKDREGYNLLLISPGVSKSIFNNRIRLDLGISYAKGSRFGRNFLMNLGVKLNFDRKTEINSKFLYQDYGKSYNEVNNLQTTVKTLLPAIRIGEKSYDLQVRLFKDLNNNGYFDAEDVVAEKFPLDINGVPFITDQAGNVKYKNLPEGGYSVSVKPEKGWYGDRVNFILNDNKNILIPLKQSGQLKGRVILNSETESQFLNVATHLKNIQIKASDKEGRNYYTLTDKEGCFRFYLPAGSYRVEILKMPPDMIFQNRGQKAKIIPKETTELNFVINFKKKKKEIIRFSEISENNK